MKVRAAAKINLFLEVLGKEKNGYHKIETIFQSISLFDELSFKETKKGIKIRCNEPKIPQGKNNLVYQAAHLLKTKAKIKKGVEIQIQKNIPVGAGLAGGSSDAAATLKGLNKLWNIGLAKNELINLGEKIGSDVPFCLSGGSALGEGRGEKLSFFSSSSFWVILAIANFSISTSWVYQNFSEEFKGKPSTKSKYRTTLMKEALQEGDIKRIGSFLYNALEKVVIKKYSLMEELKKKFKSAGALGSLMSGSGPTVFGIATDKDDAYSIARKLRKEVEVKGIKVVQTISSLRDTITS